MGLVQAELERRGIVTVSITMLPEITARISAPRVLAVPYALGYPLGEPGNRELQTAILRAMLALAPREDVPVLESWARRRT